MKQAIIFCILLQSFIVGGLRCVLIHGTGEKPVLGNAIYRFSKIDEYKKIPKDLQT